MNTLHLILKKKWFDMIESGIKKEEYREIKKFWVNRLSIPFNGSIGGDFMDDLMVISYIFKKFDAVTFSNGYSPASRKMIVECKGIDIGEAFPEWSDNWQGNVFRIHLGNILQRINFKTNPQ